MQPHYEQEDKKRYFTQLCLHVTSAQIEKKTNKLVKNKNYSFKIKSELGSSK